MNSKSRGRPRKVYDENEIENIVLKCREEWNIKGLVKYSDVYNYGLELYKRREITYKLSEDFWRKPNRQGTIILSRVNEVISDTVKVDETETEFIINTHDAIDKLFSGKEKNKQELINKLTINEVKAKQYMTANVQLRGNITKLEKEIQFLKEKSDTYKNKSETLQLLLFKVMEYSKKRGFPVENLFNTGKTRTEPVDLIMDSLFSDNPDVGYEFNNYIGNKDGKNVVPIKEGNSALDDYGEF